MLGVVVHAADIQDADGLADLLRRVKPLYPWLRAVFADSVYHRLTAMLACLLFGLTLVIVRRVAGATGFVVLPKRWIVERTLSWLTRCRRLARNLENLARTSVALIRLAMIKLMARRLARS
jgi:putative transposase